MSFSIESGNFKKYPAQWDVFTREQSGDIGKNLMERGYKLRIAAQRTVRKKSGRLAASIYVTYDRSSFAMGPAVRIGSNVHYALEVHEGTRPHIIRPNNHRLMRFVVGGKVVYAKTVKHPGTRPTKFLSRHLGSAVK